MTDKQKEGKVHLAVTVQEFGKTRSGACVRKYILENKNGMKAEILDLGAILQTLCVPDRDGNLQDVVWGFDNVADYERPGPYFGAVIGRITNLIGNSQVEISGKRYQLEPNVGPHCNHGGPHGFQNRMWNAKIISDHEVMFVLDSPDGDQGLPGNMEITVSYILTEENGLRITYRGCTDQDTLINMTNHSYFNLEGAWSETNGDHQLWLASDAYTPTDDDALPTGEIRPVDGTPMDFRKWRYLRDGFTLNHEILNQYGGYTHNFLLHPDGFDLVAKLYAEKTGIEMDVYTDQPALELYATKNLNEKTGCKYGRTYPKNSAVCLETQHTPDTPHLKHFPGILLEAGKEYKTETEYRFLVRKSS